jgi:transposase
MAGDFLEMSSEERERGHLVRAFVEARFSQREASERLGIGVRQFKRLVCAWRHGGDAVLVSRQRGRPSNRRLKEARRSEIVARLLGRYAGFGATLASEKLRELDGIEVSVETVRQMQISLGAWKPKTRRAKRVFQLRERRARFGELIQIDGSPHDWFEGRGPRAALHADRFH